MKIQVLSKRKKHHGLDEYTKSEFKEIKSFLYDEDILWLDIGKKRYGINLEVVKKMRNKLLKELRKEIKELEKDELTKLVEKKIKKIKNKNKKKAK